MSLEYSYSKKELQVGIDGYTFLRHSVNTPSLYTGRGEGIYNMSHGSFKISEKGLYKEALKHFAIAKEGVDYLEVIFENKLKLNFQYTGKRLEISFLDLTGNFNRLWISMIAFAGEHIFGLGEQYTFIDFKGKKVPLWCEEQGVGRGKNLITLLADIKYGAGGNWHTTYFPQPSFISSKSYYVLLECNSYSVFDFTEEKKHELYCHEIPARLVVSAKDNLKATLSDLSEILGKQQTLPGWIYDGVQLGIQGGKEIVDKKLDLCKNFGVPVAGVWAQDWEGVRYTSFGKQLFWNWRYNEQLYPDLPGYIRKLNDCDIHFTGYINQFLALEGDLYAEANEKNYCIKNKKGEDYLVYITTFPAAVLDITNPGTVSWIKSIIRKNMIEIGLSGWMADFGEHLPADAILHSGVSAELYHNRYPVDWIGINRDAINESGNAGKIFYFSRAGYLGSQKTSQMIWAGDQLVNWSKDDGLPTVIPAAVSLGFSGIGYHHSDIGGYTTVLWIKRSKELFMRWTEHAVFSLAMRTHEGNRPDVNWQFDSDEETLRHFARFGKIHVHLRPYLVSLALEYQISGLPVIRHPYIHYPGEKLSGNLYHYMLGSEMYVDPVVIPGQMRKEIFLPEDEWIHVFTGEKYEGGRSYRINCPPGAPPVFYLSSSNLESLFRDVRKIQ